MKKTICAVLAGTMLLALCACGAKKPGTSPSPAVTESAQPSETPVASPSASSESSAAADTALTDVLDRINNNMEPGTAGSSLKAAKLAAALLDWGETTKLSADQIKAETVAWLTPKGNDEQSSFAEKYTAVKSAVDAVAGDNGKELLDEAGVTDSHYPWNDAAFAAVKNVTEAVLGQD